MKPDYALIHRGEMNLAFDAKFRFASVTADERRLSEEIDDESELPATLVAKVDDIVKMHAYRDSLGLTPH